MITLITGTPGSGKTLYAVTKLIEEIKKNPDRPVYSDIEGLKIDGVESPPDDWRETPEGSLLIYDECQYRIPYQRARGKTRYDFILDLTKHRHGGYDIWLITQSPKFLHLDVLEVIGKHLHLERPYGAALAQVYQWRSKQSNPTGRTAKQEAESKSLFKYNKDIYNYYNSVDVTEDKANHKGLKIPFSEYKFFLIGFALIGYMLYGVASNGILGYKFFGDKEASTADFESQQFEQQNFTTTSNASFFAPAEQQSTQAQQTPEQMEMQRIAFVIASDSGCVAKNSRGMILDIPPSQCFEYNNNPRLMHAAMIQQVTQHHGDLQLLGSDPPMQSTLATPITQDAS